MVPTVLNDQTERPKIYQYCLTNVTFLIITNGHYIWFKGVIMLKNLLLSLLMKQTYVRMSNEQIFTFYVIQEHFCSYFAIRCN